MTFLGHSCFPGALEGNVRPSVKFQELFFKKKKRPHDPAFFFFFAFCCTYSQFLNAKKHILCVQLLIFPLIQFCVIYIMALLSSHR